MDQVHLWIFDGGEQLCRVMVVGGADLPSSVVQGHFVNNHAHCMVDLKGTERCSLR
jgi:hypothetical protein